MLRLTDLAAVAFVLLQGHEIVRLEPGSRPDQKVFVFRNEAAAEVERFERGAVVPAKAYAAVQRQAKRLLFRRAPECRSVTTL